MSEVNATQVQAAKDSLEQADELLEEAIGLIDEAYRIVPGSAGERIRQVRAQIEMARSSDHEWLGGSMYTLADSIQEVDELLYGTEEDDLEGPPSDGGTVR